MVFGGINQERLQLNEDTLWAGGPYDPVNTNALAALPEVRQLVFEGKYRQASGIVRQSVLSKPIGQMPYETAGDLMLTFPDSALVENYRRDLNLDTAVAGVEYTANGTRFARQVFASPVDQVIVVHLTADKKGAINFTAGLQTPQRADVTTESGNTLVMSGVNGSAQGIKGALKFQVRARVLADGGSISATSNSVSVANADSATILIALATSYKSYNDVSGDPGNNCQRPDRRRRAQEFRQVARCAYQGTSAAVPAGFAGSWPERCHEAADGRAHQEFRQRPGPAVGRALFSIRTLSADQFLASRRPAGQLAGHLE